MLYLVVCWLVCHRAVLAAGPGAGAVPVVSVTLSWQCRRRAPICRMQIRALVNGGIRWLQWVIVFRLVPHVVVVRAMLLLQRLSSTVRRLMLVLTPRIGLKVLAMLQLLVAVGTSRTRFRVFPGDSVPCRKVDLVRTTVCIRVGLMLRCLAVVVTLAVQVARPRLMRP